VICPNVARRDAVGNYVVWLARTLVDLGFDVRILSQDPADVPIDLVPLAASTGEVRALADLDEPLREHFRSSRVVFFEYPIHYGLIETIAEKIDGEKVFDYHGVTPPHLWVGPGREPLARGIERASLAKNASHVIAHSSFSRDELLARVALDPARVRIHGYPVPLDAFAAAAHKPRPGGRGETKLLYVGRMAANKRIDVLVEGLARLCAAGENARLLLAGDGERPPYRRHLCAALRRARSLAVAPYVHYLGIVPEADLPDLFAGADVYVTASEHEGFGIPLIEAMAAGLPVVATRAGAIPETLGGSGILVPPRDPAALAEAVLRIVRDPEQRAALIARGRERAIEFAPSRQRALLDRFLREIGLSPAPNVAPGAPFRDAGERRLALVERAVSMLPVYRDFTHGGKLWRLFARVRAAMTRHVVRHHVDVIAARHAEALAELFEQIRTLREALSAERAARAAETADAARAIARLESEIVELRRRIAPPDRNGETPR
jgi:glycosyltransferase involved in cell wall biosynthesis